MAEAAGALELKVHSLYDLKAADPANVAELALLHKKLTPEDVIMLCGILSQCTNLRTLTLSNNTLTAETVLLLAAYLPHLENLQVLRLFNNALNSKAMAALAPVLKACPNLQELDVEHNNLGSAGVAAIAQALPASCPNLRTLRLASTAAGTEGVAAIAQALQACPNLQELHLESNDAGPEGVAVIAQALAACPNLQKLYLASNRADTASAVVLSQALQIHQGLHTLDISYNSSIGIAGVVAIAFAVPHTLRNLYVAGTGLRVGHNDEYGIGADLAKGLAACLAACQHLVILDLSGNKGLWRAGIQLFEPVFSQLPRLETLNLANNNLKPEDLQLLAIYLKKLQALKSIDLMENRSLDHEAIALLKAALPKVYIQYSQAKQPTVFFEAGAGAAAAAPLAPPPGKK